MKKTIEVSWRQGCFWVLDGSMRETNFGVRADGPRYQVIADDVLETMRSGKGYVGLELDISKQVEAEALKMELALRAQGDDVGMLILT